MAFYENTIIAKQDLSEAEFLKLRDKYNELINNNSGKVVKIEQWGILNLSNKIKNYKKGIYLHIKFEGEKKTLDEFHKRVKLDNSIIRHLTVKYDKLDLKNEYFNSK